MHFLWKLNRLRVMQPREIAYRVGRATQERLERYGFGLASPTPARGRAGLPWCERFPVDVDPGPYVEAADRVLAGRFDVFAMQGIELGFPPRWNRDAKTGIVAPLDLGKGIDYRDERLVGDVKYVWEPNRHLELVTLAQAWYLTREARFGDGCRILLESWFEDCPYPRGINWTSSLELAVRLLNWYFAWHFLGGDEAPAFDGDEGRAFREGWLRSIYQHCHFIAGHLSLHSSANNHLLGEYLGLLVGATGWPMWPQSARWQRIATDGFASETLRQNGPDGVNREHAIYYQHEVVDMALLAGLIGRANGAEFGCAYWERLERMIDYLAAVMDCAGNVPMIGDSDDAVMVRLSPLRGFHVYRSLLATGAMLFDRPDLARKARSLDDKSRWLLGDAAQQKFDVLLQSSNRSSQVRGMTRAFTGGGYYLLGSELDGPREIRLLADAGQLGYLSIAAHGHADALSCTLSVAGHELLIDPGTFTYHARQLWRDYFRGTSAHNTVRVDALDQSVSGGAFLWLRHAHARCERFETGETQDLFVGSHDGYRRLADAVTHRREIVLDKVHKRIEVRDEIECAASHEVEVFWHFAEDCQVELAGRAVLVTKGPVRLRMLLSGADFDLECVRGCESPPLGWVSRCFDTKKPSPTIRWFGRVTGPSRWSTDIAVALDAEERPFEDAADARSTRVCGA